MNRFKTFIDIKYTIVFLFSILCSMRCSEEVATESDSRLALSRHLNIDCGKSKGYDAGTLLKRTEFIKLETVDSALIGEATEVKIVNDRIYVFDRKQSKGIFCFNIDGSFRFSVQKEGRGPGEYHYMQSFFVDPNNHRIYIVDDLEQILVYDDYGAFIHDIRSKLIIKNIYRLPSGKWLARPAYGEVLKRNQQANYRLLLLSEDLMNIEQTYLRGQKYIDGAFFPKVFHELGNRIFINYGFTDTVFQFTEEQKLHPSFTTNFGKRALPQHLHDSKSFSSFFAETNEMSPSVCGPPMNWNEGEAFISFSYPYLGEDRHGQVLYSQTTGNVKLIDQIEFEEEGAKFYLPIPQDIYHQSFVGIITVDQIELDNKSNSQTGRSFGVSSKITDFFIQESDNPIVILTEYLPF